VLSEGRRVLWDSEKVASADETDIPYGGPALQSNSTYSWSVRVWDASGRPSAWSRSVTFETALLSPSDWSAKWIGRDDPQTPPALGQQAPAPLLRVWDAPDATFMRPSTKRVEIDPRVAPAADEAVIEKAAPNGFVGTTLDRRLRDAAVDEVVVVGMMSSMCVDATVRAAVDLGFAATVVHDACAAPDHRAFVDDVELPFDRRQRLVVDAVGEVEPTVEAAFARVRATLRELVAETFRQTPTGALLRSAAEAIATKRRRLARRSSTRPEDIWTSPTRAGSPS
jgi:nicotinamidase-related amidase